MTPEKLRMIDEFIECSKEKIEGWFYNDGTQPIKAMTRSILPPIPDSFETDTGKWFMYFSKDKPEQFTPGQRVLVRNNKKDRYEPAIYIKYYSERLCSHEVNLGDTSNGSIVFCIPYDADIMWKSIEGGEK